MKKLISRCLRAIGRLIFADLRHEILREQNIALRELHVFSKENLARHDQLMQRFDELHSILVKQNEIAVKTLKQLNDQSTVLVDQLKENTALVSGVDRHVETLHNEFIKPDTVNKRLSELDARFVDLDNSLSTQKTALLRLEGGQKELLGAWRGAQAQKMDLRLAAQSEATRTTAEYVRTHMPDVQSVDHKFKVHDVALEHVSVEGGLILEFGVLTGRTINYIADHCTGQIVSGFDSFEGLPETWRDGYEVGHFRQDKLPEVRENVRLYKGWFEDSIPTFLQRPDAQTTPVAYLHVDCDLYSSTVTIFTELSKHLVPGSVIVFDEYFNYDGWQVGEFRAFREFLQMTGMSYEYLTYNRLHEQVAVKLIG